VNLAPIPVVDIFSGPGGLGEGFSRVGGGRAFKTIIAIEKDPHAVETLKLRAFYRAIAFKGAPLPDGYLDLLQATTSAARDEALALIAKCPEWHDAVREVKCLELGKHNDLYHDEIESRLAGRKDWVLIGGPPCQAYSLVGRSRMQNHEGLVHDDRHFLYKQYLEIIEKHGPAIFVMENVKGLNTAKVAGQRILPQILHDLKNAGAGYDLFSLGGGGAQLLPGEEVGDFLIRAERYGVPQSRHRVIIVGVRKGFAAKPVSLKEKPEVSVFEAISDLPPLLGLDSARDRSSYAQLERGAPFRRVKSNSVLADANGYRSFIAPIHPSMDGCLLNHEARSHMAEDLRRYRWWAEQAELTGESPKLDDEEFPEEHRPKHKNLNSDGPLVFADRFKVQVRGRPSGTVTSHISKDGHYYIHYDPRQNRSFSVREAARIQTFPDDYFFMGNRTQQYHQVGNAVPPYLAYQIACEVWRAFCGSVT
jgi:DNA (cytosine-5)-methyltransferase 1